MSTHSNNIHTEASNRLTPKEIFFKYLIYLPLFITSLVVAITIAYLYIRYTVPMYNSTISIVVNTDKGNKGYAEDLPIDGLMLYKGTNLSNEIELLKSTTMMERVVKNLHLHLQYFSEGKVKLTEMYPSYIVRAEILQIRDSIQSERITLKPLKDQLLAELNGMQKIIKSGDTLSTAGASYRIRFDAGLLNKDYKYYIQRSGIRTVAAGLAAALNIKQPVRDASILRLSIITQIPQKGEAILNQLMNEYAAVNIEEKNKAVVKTMGFIDERLSFLNSELDEVETNLKEFREKNAVVDLEMQSSSDYSKLQGLTEAITEQEIQLQVVGMIRNYVSNAETKFQLVPTSLSIADPTLSALISNYNQLQLKRSEELRTMEPAHPAIRQTEGQIEKLRVSIIENLRNVGHSYENLKQVKEQEYNAFQAKLTTIPSKQKELLEIMRQQGIKEKLFLFLLEKREESAISAAAAVSSVKSLDPAVSQGPVSPNTTSIYRLAFILGIAIPFGFIYLKDLLNDKIITRTDISKDTETPIIGEIAHHQSMTRKFVVGLKDRSVLAEQFRIIRTNLQFLMTHAPQKNPVLMVTSSISGEGKTFCSMNLAAVWALAGKKTVILELDLRKPKIAKSLDLAIDKGITNYILGKQKAEDLPQQLTGLPNLYVVTAGPIPPNPSEMIMDKKMDELFSYMRANFDMIIIDSAPVGLVSDSKILAKFADVCLYVVRQRYTVKKQMAAIDELYRNKVLPNMGIVVNDVKIGGVHSYYGYGYGYGYSYNYSYGYGEQKKKTFVERMKDMVGL